MRGTRFSKYVHIYFCIDLYVRANLLTRPEGTKDPPNKFTMNPLPTIQKYNQEFQQFNHILRPGIIRKYAKLEIQANQKLPEIQTNTSSKPEIQTRNSSKPENQTRNSSKPKNMNKPMHCRNRIPSNSWSRMYVSLLWGTHITYFAPKRNTNNHFGLRIVEPMITSKTQPKISKLNVDSNFGSNHHIDGKRITALAR